MKPLRTRLEEARHRLGLPWEVLERDYLLSWVLAGLARVDSLRDTLVFKGGTALKKCYFGDYRFSEDLDFSGLDGVPTGEDLERAVRDACGATYRDEGCRVITIGSLSREAGAAHAHTQQQDTTFLVRTHFFGCPCRQTACFDLLWGTARHKVQIRCPGVAK